MAAPRPIEKWRSPNTLRLPAPDGVPPPGYGTRWRRPLASKGGRRQRKQRLTRGALLDPPQFLRLPHGDAL